MTQSYQKTVSLFIRKAANAISVLTLLTSINLFSTVQAKDGELASIDETQVLDIVALCQGSNASQDLEIYIDLNSFLRSPQTVHRALLVIRQEMTANTPGHFVFPLTLKKIKGIPYFKNKADTIKVKFQNNELWINQNGITSQYQCSYLRDL